MSQRDPRDAPSSPAPQADAGTPDLQYLLRLVASQVYDANLLRLARRLEQNAAMLERSNPEAARIWNPDRLASARYLREFVAHRAESGWTRPI